MRNARRGSLGAPLYWLFSILLVSLLAPFTESAIGEDGICNIFAFVPFTIEYVPSIHYYGLCSLLVASHVELVVLAS